MFRPVSGLGCWQFLPEPCGIWILGSSGVWHFASPDELAQNGCGLSIESFASTPMASIRGTSDELFVRLCSLLHLSQNCLTPTVDSLRFHSPPIAPGDSAGTFCKPLGKRFARPM